MIRSPELHPNLLGTPSLATRAHHAIHKLAHEANLAVQLMDLLRACTGLRPCDPHSPDQYQPDEHLRAIERGDLGRAHHLLTIYGVSTP